MLISDLIPSIYESWSTSGLRVRLTCSDTGLSPPVFFSDRFKAVLLLWIICVIYVLCLPCFRVCSFLPCGNLKGKCWPLCSLWCLLWFCYFPIWYPKTGVVLDCIDSRSVLSFYFELIGKGYHGVRISCTFRKDIPFSSPITGGRKKLKLSCELACKVWE